MEVKELFERGIIGVVKYNEVEEAHQLETPSLDFGLYPLWDDFEGKKVKITIEILEE